MLREIAITAATTALLVTVQGGAVRAVQGATIHVPADQPSIQVAIDASVDGDTVLVSPGTYLENIDFHGKAIAVASESGPDLTIIDGGQAGSVVKMVSGEDSGSVLSGFTLQHGRSSYGGGIQIDNISYPLPVATKAPKIVNNKITSNTSCNGAGISVESSAPLIQGNIISNNNAAEVFCAVGGAGGGGIYVGAPSGAKILDNKISNNVSMWPGGGISLLGAGTPLIKNNVILNNKVSGQILSEGGGIYLINWVEAQIIQNLIVGNEASKGGGIYWWDSKYTPGAHVASNTIAYNIASQGGSAIYAAGFDGDATLVNNILVSTATSTVRCDSIYDLSVPIFQSNDVSSHQGTPYTDLCSDYTGIDGNISADPQFVYQPGNNYHLRPSSPAIDAGNNAATGLPAMDFDGGIRPVDGNADSTAAHDMGVYEYDPSIDADGDGMPDSLDNCPSVINYDQINSDADSLGDACDPDDDNDTIIDPSDNCPIVLNEAQENSDADPFGDACDNCPIVPNPAQSDVDGDLAGDACDAPGTGNVDCSTLPNGVDSVDALKVLRHSASLSVAQNEPCTNIGAGPLASGWMQGDVNCSGGVSSVDALLILRVSAGLPVNIPVGCPAIKPL